MRGTLTNQTCTNLVVSVCTKAYPVAAIHRALYWLADEVSSKVEIADENNVNIILNPLAAPLSDDIEERLLRSLNDFALRVDIEQRTRDLRNSIIQAALHEAILPPKG